MIMTIWEDLGDMLKLSATNKEHNNKKEEKEDAARDPAGEVEAHYAIMTAWGRTSPAGRAQIQMTDKEPRVNKVSC